VRIVSSGMIARFLALIFIFGAVLSQAADTKKRPNILFCFADDWGRYASCYKGLDGRPNLNDVVQTPNIDRIAARGVIFTNAFVGSPSCTPCRSALLSGRYFFNTGMGAILNGAKWDSAIPSWPLLLRDSGYHIGKMYKVWSPGIPADAPYGKQEYAYETAGRQMCKFSDRVTKLVGEGKAVEAAKQEIIDQVRKNFTAFLDANKSGAPWCFWYGPTNTHRTWVKGSGKALWGIEPDSLKGKLPAFLPDVPEVREDVADYLGEAQAWDASCGAIFKILEERGEMENTVVVISGDHGIGGMPHAKCNLYDFGVNVALVAAGPGIKGSSRVVQDFVWLPDLAATFLETGGVANPEGMAARSIWPTLRSDKTGLVDETRTWVVTGRERHVANAREGNLPYPHRALRTKDFLFIRNFAPNRWPMGSPKQVTDTTEPTATELENDTFVAFADMDSSPTKAYYVAHRHDSDMKNLYAMAFALRPGDELYDLRKDPDQMHNLANDPAYAKQHEELAAQLMKVLKDHKDPRVMGDGSTFDKPPFTDVEPNLGKIQARKLEKKKEAAK
jgi:arylsulfatase A-like enzyme